jgi:hypothetical protein
MATKENNPEVTEDVTATDSSAFTAFSEAAEEVSSPDSKFTAEDIAKARAQEKDKLYPTVEKLKEELGLLRKREEERAAEEATRAAKRNELAAARAAEKKAQEEDEMSFKALLKAKETEWQAQLEQERNERETAFALLEQERRYHELSNFRQQRLEQERDNIIPELIDLISGNTQDEIEQSISGLKEKTAKIFDSVQAASQQSRKEMVGSRVTMPTSGPLDNESDSRNPSASDIANMSMTDYAKNRAKYLGTASNNRGQGLFG